MTEHYSALPVELQRYRKTVRSAMIRVKDRVTGVERRIPDQDLAQAAWLIVFEQHGRWEANARNLDAYARTRLTHELCNAARAILRTQGYGKTAGKWGTLRATVDPRTRGVPTDWQGLMPGDVIDAEAQASDNLDGPDRIPGIYDRSPHWARTFRQTFPEAAEAFLQLDDRQKPTTLGITEWNRRQDAARDRLRVQYAREIAIIDDIEEVRADGRLLRAMFGPEAAAA